MAQDLRAGSRRYGGGIRAGVSIRRAGATGSQLGAYYGYAQRYRDILERPEFGVHLEIRTTAGSSTNLNLLEMAENPVELAFVQGGMGNPKAESGLLALASVYFEPLWVFHRNALTAKQLTDLAGSLIAVGEEGSGTRTMALELLAENGIALDTTLPLGGDAAVKALREGEIDAAFFVASSESPIVRKLLTSPGVGLMDFSRAAAYTRRHRHVSSVTLPTGVIDLEKNIPDRDITLIATSATLVARDLHPALVDLVLQAASEVHGSQGIFEDAGQFPSPEYITFPLSKEARRHFVHGPPFLKRVFPALPFWVASLIDRLKVMLLPLLVLLVPLFKVLPPTYRWRVRSKIYRWYKQIQAIEARFRESESDEQRQETLTELSRIDKEIALVTVPLSYADELFDLRLHLNMVRERIEALVD